VTDAHFVAEGPPEVAAFLEGRGFGVTLLPDDIELEAESQAWASLPRCDAIVAELVDINLARQKMLRQHADSLIVFDDLLDHVYCADIVVCGQELPAYGNQAMSAAGTRFLVGYEYFLLDPKLLQFRHGERDFPAVARKVLVAFGGGRYDVAYLKTARALAGCPGLSATFVLGPAASPWLREALRDQLPNAELLGSVENMGERLRDADLAIVSGGYLKLEAAVTGTPAMMIATQWHQVPLAEQFAGRTSMPYLGYQGFIEPADIRECIQRFRDPGLRKETGEHAAAIVDGCGMERVYDEIFG